MGTERSYDWMTFLIVDLISLFFLKKMVIL